LKKTVIVVCGPTASGKTRFAIDLALKHNTAIISADSRQCYRELRIGVARPSPEELNQVPHYFIASHSIHEEITAAGFEEYAINKVNELFRDHDIVIMAGGTGLYIKAFTEGLDAMPEIDPAIRKNIREKYDQQGIEWLQGELQKKDQLFFEKGEMKNPQRMMRALEVVESTGSSILSYQRKNKNARIFNIEKIGLDPGKEVLHSNIDNRVNKMIADGLVEEVKSLLPFRHLNALQTVGYQEIFDYLDGKMDLEKAVSLVKQNTRQYAKRQLTWFRRDKEINWIKT
jgi:tRNA dimethylallyltransferase